MVNSFRTTSLFFRLLVLLDTSGLLDVVYLLLPQPFYHSCACMLTMCSGSFLHHTYFSANHPRLHFHLGTFTPFLSHLPINHHHPGRQSNCILINQEAGHTPQFWERFWSLSFVNVSGPLGSIQPISPGSCPFIIKHDFAHRLGFSVIIDFLCSELDFLLYLVSVSLHCTTCTPNIHCKPHHCVGIYIYNPFLKHFFLPKLLSYLFDRFYQFTNFTVFYLVSFITIWQPPHSLRRSKHSSKYYHVDYSLFLFFPLLVYDAPTIHFLSLPFFFFPVALAKIFWSWNFFSYYFCHFVLWYSSSFLSVPSSPPQKAHSTSRRVRLCALLHPFRVIVAVAVAQPTSSAMSTNIELALQTREHWYRPTVMRSAASYLPSPCSFEALVCDLMDFADAFFNYVPYTFKSSSYSHTLNTTNGHRTDSKSAMTLKLSFSSKRSIIALDMAYFAIAPSSTLVSSFAIFWMVVVLAPFSANKDCNICWVKTNSNL